MIDLKLTNHLSNTLIKTLVEGHNEMNKDLIADGEMPVSFRNIERNAECNEEYIQEWFEKEFDINIDSVEIRTVSWAYAEYIADEAWSDLIYKQPE